VAVILRRRGVIKIGMDAGGKPPGQVSGLPHAVTCFACSAKEPGSASLLAGDHSADERVAAFPIALASRHAARGFSATRLHLSMSRGDIANYLRLAAETVSRVLSRFRAQKLIQIEGWELELSDPKGLRTIGQGVVAGVMVLLEGRLSTQNGQSIYSVSLGGEGGSCQAPREIGSVSAAVHPARHATPAADLPAASCATRSPPAR
jgi:hypothetical protein